MEWETSCLQFRDSLLDTFLKSGVVVQPLVLTNPLDGDDLIVPAAAIHLPEASASNDVVRIEVIARLDQSVRVLIINLDFWLSRLQ